MKKQLILIITLCLLQTCLFAAQHPAPFTIKIKCTNPAVNLVNIGESYFFKEYCATVFNSTTSTSDNGVFTFTGTLLYPTAVRFFSDTKDSISFNHLIFIDSGYQEIELVASDKITYVKVSNPTRVQNEYMQFMQNYKLKELEDISQNNLKKYIASNPKSYISLFALIYQTDFSYSFNSETKGMTNLLSAQIKETKGYQYFKQRYFSYKKLGTLIVKSKNNKEITLTFTNKNKPYTLLEFWYTGCVPCIQSMQRLKKIYNPSMAKKLNIISICTDDNKISEESKKLFAGIKAPWVNYWDMDATAFGVYIDKLKFSVGNTVYPTSVLVNSEGEIIARDIDFKELHKFML